MIRGIHYFSTELKTKIDVIPRSCFKFPKKNIFLYSDGDHFVTRGRKHYSQCKISLRYRRALVAGIPPETSAGLSYFRDEWIRPTVENGSDTRRFADRAPNIPDYSYYTLCDLLLDLAPGKMLFKQCFNDGSTS